MEKLEIHGHTVIIMRDGNELAVSDNKDLAAKETWCPRVTSNRDFEEMLIKAQMVLDNIPGSRVLGLRAPRRLVADLYDYVASYEWSNEAARNCAPKEESKKVSGGIVQPDLFNTPKGKVGKNG